MTLTEFLLARIAEDEAIAGELPADGYYTDDQRVLEVPPDAQGLAWPRRWSPVRVLVKCEVERRIVEHHAPYAGGSGRPTLLLLAAVYADHPDYRDEWKP